MKVAEKRPLADHPLRALRGSRSRPSRNIASQSKEDAALHRAQIVGAFLLLALLLSSCSRGSFLALCNNSGATIEVVRASYPDNSSGIPPGNKDWSFPWTWRFLVRDGEDRDIAYESSSGWEVELRASGCV